MKHNAEDFEKSLFVRVRKISLSVLLGRDRRFARWILGSTAQKPRLRSLTSKPALFPHLRLSRIAAPPTRTSNKASE